VLALLTSLSALSVNCARGAARTTSRRTSGQRWCAAPCPSWWPRPTLASLCPPQRLPPGTVLHTPWALAPAPAGVPLECPWGASEFVPATTPSSRYSTTLLGPFAPAPAGVPLECPWGASEVCARRNAFLQVHSLGFSCPRPGRRIPGVPLSSPDVPLILKQPLLSALSGGAILRGGGRVHCKGRQGQMERRQWLRTGHVQLLAPHALFWGCFTGVVWRGVPQVNKAEEKTTVVQWLRYLLKAHDAYDDMLRWKDDPSRSPTSSWPSWTCPWSTPSAASACTSPRRSDLSPAPTPPPPLAVFLFWLSDSSGMTLRVPPLPARRHAGQTWGPTPPLPRC